MTFSPGSTGSVLLSPMSAAWTRLYHCSFFVLPLSFFLFTSTCHLSSSHLFSSILFSTIYLISCHLQIILYGLFSSIYPLLLPFILLLIFCHLFSLILHLAYSIYCHLFAPFILFGLFYLLSIAIYFHLFFPFDLSSSSATFPIYFGPFPSILLLFRFMFLIYFYSVFIYPIYFVFFRLLTRRGWVAGSAWKAALSGLLPTY